MTASLAFLLPVLPISIYAAWSDLTTMTIPNWVTVALLVSYVIVAPFFLPLETIGISIAATAVVLLIGFFLNMIGVMGGGDAKYLTGITPFINHSEVSAFLLIFSISLIATLILHRIAMRIEPLRRATDHWASWSAGRNFPMGISIAAAIIVYLALLSFAGV